MNGNNQPYNQNTNVKQGQSERSQSQRRKRMIRQWTSVWMALLLTLSIFTATVPVSAAPVSGQPTIHIDQKQVGYSQAVPVIQQQTTLVPLRATLEAMGAKLDNVSRQSITINIDGKKINITDKLTMIDGVTYIPVRTLAELSGHTVSWSSKEQSIVLVSGTSTAERPASSGTSHPSPDAASETQAEGGRGFLWEVKHGDNVVDLVGSMHIADDSFYPLRKEYEQAFKEADYLGVEVDISKVGEAQQQQSLKLGMYQDGSTLKDHIAPATYARLGKVLEQENMKPDALDAFKPWMVELTLVNLQAAKSGYAASSGVDLYFLKQASERKLPVIELETFDSQLNMLNGFSSELQENNLIAALDSMGKHDQAVTLTDMANMWKSGNDEQLLEMTTNMAPDPEYRQAMLTDRNIGMADKIDHYLQQGSGKRYFIVVGAAHYLGQDGIIQLLQNKGYTVTRK
ncbi:TraB/GumN family protein [Paenibacillus wenxiniae]|uniref:TraB/GumN family protein n=1 Tax=Paenibacillus wenxiniae TaxID=1636843 RepID=A0ABW4REJ8_9BACL